MKYYDQELDYVVIWMLCRNISVVDCEKVETTVKQTFISADVEEDSEFNDNMCVDVRDV